MADEIRYEPMNEIKTGKYIMIDGTPCKVVELEHSKPGKHGSAKVRITAIGIFDGSKKTLLSPSHGDVEVPVITKKRAQVVSVTGSTVQLMDLENYETFESDIKEDFKDLKAGAEVEVIETMGKRALLRILSG